MTNVDSEMLEKVSMNRAEKKLTATYRNGGTYVHKGVTRYRRDAVVNGKINGSVGQSMWTYVLGQFPYEKVA